MAKKLLDTIIPKLAKNAQQVVKKRYLKLDKNGCPIETPAEMFWRVACFMASADSNYLSKNERKEKIQKTACDFYKILASLKFLPAGRILFEAGNKHIGQFSSCFVVPISDSVKDIFNSLTNAAIIQQHNGGTGFNFSNIRPKGDQVRGIPNVAAGPIHYIKTFNQALSRVLQGSKRHGANMGILNITHPDILEFISLKENQEIKNFNISVGITDDFMEKVREDEDYELINPRNKKVVQKLNARYVFNLIAEKAWSCADPGIIFLDRLKETNPTPHLGEIEATNPCGEQPLLPYESCNLGSVVLPAHIKNGKINWADLRKTIRCAVHFMDNVIDLNNYPLPIIKQNVLKTRKIGLGIMGFAQGLYKLNIPYNSEEALALAEKVMKFIKEEGQKMSKELAKKRGVFPAYHGSVFEKEGIKVRNATITTIAPNGTISMVANTSSGIEPVFALVNIRKTFFEEKENKEGDTLIFVDSVFEEIAKREGFYSKTLINKIAQEGTIQNFTEIPKRIKRIFVTAHDIPYDWHVKIQAAAQKYTDNAVSKTINFPHNATIDQVKKAFILAYELGCKGVTIYRDGSKQSQILYSKKIQKKKKKASFKSLALKQKTEKKFSETPILTENAKVVLEKRALKKDKTGKVIETPDQLFKRVAKFIARADYAYPAFKSKISETEQKFYHMLSNLEFISGQALRNTGDKNLTLSACFVLPIEDSMDSIMQAMTENVLVHKATCGTGINFSRLRSKNSQVGSTKELAAGPVAFMKAFNATQETIRTKGGRKQGSMVILNIDHPDIEEFICAKDDPKELINFNISVGIKNNFMEALAKNKDYALVDPHTKKCVKRVPARKLFDLLVDHAWKSGDPGILFLDRIEKDNPTPFLGKLETTNPCGEQPLLPYETCNLGSIVLSRMIYERNGKKEIHWQKLKERVRYAVHFLDNTIDLNRFPLPQMEKMAKANRKIGLGVMGFADLLIELGIPYNSNAAVKLAENLMRFISKEARLASYELGKKKGSFKNFKKSIWAKKYKAMRNAAITTIAPTGYTSIVANCSSGIEPIYALVFKRENSIGGVEQFEVHPLFKKVAKQEGFYSEDLINKIFEKGSIKDFKEIPERIKKIFVTSRDIEPLWDLKIQAAFQKYTDNAVSKTINFPNSATREDIAKVYKKAYELGCKGITVYRDGCKQDQVLRIGNNKKKKKEEASTKIAILKPRPRPEVVRGSTYELKTAYGGLYVTVNNDEEGKPFEVFATIGKAGGFFAAESEAICRLISLALRSGIPAAQIIKQLLGIRGPMPTWSKKGTILSIPDAIAKILSEHIKKNQVKLPLNYSNANQNAKETFSSTDQEKLEDNSNSENLQVIKQALFKNKIKKRSFEKEKPISLADVGHAPECPDCGNILEFAEGCINCRACGYSKCG